MSTKGLKRGGVVAFGRPADAREQLVIMVETSRSANQELLQTGTSESEGASRVAASDVVLVRQDPIDRTSSADYDKWFSGLGILLVGFRASIK